MEVSHEYIKLRKNFGRQPKFVDSLPDVFEEYLPDGGRDSDYVERNPATVNIQCVASMSEHEVNTETVEYSKTGINHIEGGWPKDVDPSEPEQTIRFRKKIEKDEDYIKSIKSLSDTLEKCVKQNNAIDVFEEYFSGAYADHSSEPPSAKTLTVFRDPQDIKRTASSISWSFEKTKKVAVSYCNLEFQKSPEGMSAKSYIWDISNPNTPDMEIIPPSPLVSIEYNPKDTHVILGGSYNGLLSFWDSRKGSNAVDTSPIEKSHRDPIYSVAWLNSKTGTECSSVSTDGQLCFWDTRKLGEPTEVITLDPKGDSAPFGGTALEYNVAAGSSKFLVGTEQGSVVLCNRKGKTKADKVGTQYTGHHGPVYAVKRHPFQPKAFLTIGDWTARVWFEDLKTPIMTTKYHDSYLTDGCWSPTRPGVFFTAKQDGSVDIWDYFYKQNDPVYTIQVLDCAIQSLSIDRDGKLLAVGGVDGSVTLYELSEGLIAIQQNEKQSVNAMFDREQKREKNLETRAKELRAKSKKRDNTNKKEDNKADVNDEVLKGVEEEFFEAVSKGEEAASE
mmetsp:Transcript_3157/g.6112  ORF Transcript_3157/g.6112 Transcript_3157/m.6112 type:complete len:559 (-) Transcript_3157:222-1898(-)|eukprot:CAMPEP_0113909910 /NCGR_PEP_ID=MMETSP0780_2-20120614/27166_1 /TAXON_ID=652834 /ORGANISM="Palpitomonas bilix" /LENGTH=558 /DNA_ID=CAMNT_0000905875 /DNA_START=151 /DNA_END=1827 /DNA_ORIENTATION=+ /assembly_acc=CAM_ASM_000599